MAAVIVRAAMFLVAIAAIVVSAVWLHDARSYAHAQKVALAARTPAQFERAAPLFEKGRALQPDTLSQAAEAVALLRAGQNARAGSVLEEVVRREPRNVRAWIGLYLADRTANPARAAEAQRHIRELAPPVGPGGR